MENIAQIFSQVDRLEAVEALKAALPHCVEATVNEVGLDGLKAFFNGYKEAPECAVLAA